jgi:hypothetical protein
MASSALPRQLIDVEQHPSNPESATMNTRLLAVAAAATFASAAPRITSAQGTPDKPTPVAADSAKDVDPAGTYTTYLTAQGNAMTTVTKIEKRADGTYGGTVSGDGIPPLPVNTVTVKGNTIKVSLSAPDGSEAVIEMVMKGLEFTGKWSMAGDGSSVTGTKSP